MDDGVFIAHFSVVPLPAGGRAVEFSFFEKLKNVISNILEKAPTGGYPAGAFLLPVYEAGEQTPVGLIHRSSEMTQNQIPP